MIQNLNARGNVVPGVLSQLLICVRRSQIHPRIANKPFPGLSSEEPFSGFEGGDNSLDVKVGAQIIRIDDGRFKRIQIPEFYRPAYPVQKMVRGRTRG